MRHVLFFLISCAFLPYNSEAARVESFRDLMNCIDENRAYAGEANFRKFMRGGYGGLVDEKHKKLGIYILRFMDTPEGLEFFNSVHALVQELDSVIIGLRGSKSEVRRETGARLSTHLDSPVGKGPLRTFGSAGSSPGASASSTPALPVAGSPGAAAAPKAKTSSLSVAVDVAAERTKSPTRRGFLGGGSADDSAKEMEALKAKLKEAQEQRDAAVAALAASQSTSVPVMEALRKELDAQAKSFAAERTALEAAIATLNAKITSQDQGVTALKETNKFLEGKQDVIDKLTKQVAALTILKPFAKNLSEARILKLKAELRDQAAKLVEANEKHKRQVAQLNARIADQDRDLATDKTKVGTLQDQLTAEAKSHEKRAGELTAQIDKLQGEIATLKAQQASEQALRAAEARRAVPVADTGCFGGFGRSKGAHRSGASATAV